MEERRQDYPHILQVLEEIRDDLSEAKLNAERIATLVEERNHTALAWRVDVCKKFDNFAKKIEDLGSNIKKDLPCIETEKRLRAVEIDFSNMKGKAGVIGGVIGAVVGIVASWIGKYIFGK